MAGKLGQVLTVLAVIGGGWRLAQGQQRKSLPDKSGYTLLNPTPPQSMREMQTDRPDKTDSPFTIDAGHLQVESSLLDYLHDNAAQQTSLGITELRLGILNQLELSLFVDCYIHEINGPSDHRSGYGDTWIGSKINFWGNNEGKTAMGLITFLKLPTNQDDLGNHSIEGYIGLPIDFKLPHGFDLPFESVIAFNRNAFADGYHAEFANSAALHHDLLKNVDGFVELWTNVSTEEHTSWQATFDFGVQWTVVKNVAIDVDAFIGLTDSAPDYELLVGLSFRL